MKNKAYYEGLDKRTKEYKDYKNGIVTIESGGVGDTIEKIATKTGAKKLMEIFVQGKDCGCDQRKEKINKLMPYRFKARCLTEEEYLSWKKFKEVRTLRLSWKQIQYVCKIYSDVFNRLYWEPCVNCSPKPLMGMIEKIDLVYQTYE